MPQIPRPRRPTRPGRPSRPGRLAGGRRSGGQAGVARVVVLGDLMVDVVLAPARALETGTDVPGTVMLAQGGSAANTARWLARLGARSSLIAAVGRDAAGRALVAALVGDGVTPHISRVAGARTGRIGVVVAPGGERTFVADRGAADALAPDDLQAAWFTGADALHLPFYSLIGAPLGDAGRRAIELARAAGALITIDLASSGPLLAEGRRTSRTMLSGLKPDLLFATASEADGLLAGRAIEDMLEIAAVVVIKRGPKGATVLARGSGERIRFEVATRQVAAADTTGAGDAFDAGFLFGWLAGRAAGRSATASLQRAAVAGHRAAARQLSVPRPELPLG